jgi:hypothetical protein
MKLYDYQKEMINAYFTKRRVISNTSRQLGKCVSLNTPITIKNKEFYNGEPFTVTIGEFYQWQTFVREGKRLLNKQSQTNQRLTDES